MPASYDLNHSKYTVQKIVQMNGKRKIRITTLVRNNENKNRKKKSKQKPSETNT